MSGQHQDTAVDRVISDYATARRALDALLNQARDFGARFERLGHGLSAHPMRIIIGTQAQVRDDLGDDLSEWDVIPSHPLPSIEKLVALTDDIRETARRVDDLRARLILMGRADLVQEPGEFFE
jgi:hypothetical protein